MIIRFLLFGVIGWCMEILWTGFGSLFKGDFSMMAKTSVWMFFIYGAGALFYPLINYVMKYPLIVRGGIYVLCIFLAEFVSGYIMTKFQSCPWDYSGAKYNIMGIIRLDYAPLWFFVGMVFEFTHVRLNDFV